MAMMGHDREDPAYAGMSPNWDKPTSRPVIWINGWPAVGKASVAGFIKALMGLSEAVIVNEDGEDDHLCPTVEFDSHADCADENAAESPAASARRAAAIARHIVSEQSRGRTTIFTACQPRTDKGCRIAAEYAAAARLAGRLFVPVNLTCDADENVRRLHRQAECAISHHQHRPGPDADRLAQVRRMGLFVFSDDLAPTPTPTPTPPRPQLSRGFYTTSSAGATDSSVVHERRPLLPLPTLSPPDSPPHQHQHQHHHGPLLDQDSAAAATLTLDVSRKTSMQAGFDIVTHVQAMERRQMCSERAAELKVAAAVIQVKRKEAARLAAEELAKRAAFASISRPKSA